MNERIEKLAKQAGVNLSAFQFSGTPIKYEVTESELEKLAELIVRECVNVLHDNELWNRHISHALKEHFGVE